MPTVRGLHFVCRNDLNVTDHGDGTFETGSWYVARQHAETAEYVALHESKAERSYRHGRILRWYTVLYEGKTRVVFVVCQEGPLREWVGDGAGEKGYAWC
jgi:hypothetical protein